ncbi:mechanosensitive ion channel protein MscS [Bacterioplanes sanyensis]|uniref:Mechanosensitive ion channel protein MscS n=1 Tax=Bacterioplanes sanyensis TaxID=1249553 RepID=A0A222FHY7_9GAMM|nr:mechanosensitive ion channel family protein [Bacterioplanes sanyensis]ASP38380.1 mechanosensitive ion channel protein MscS [Bacterioplanes sanyensis]
MDWWQDLLNQNYDWFWDVGIALSLTLTLAFLWRMARHKMLVLAAKTRNRWDDVVVEAIGVPINWAILAIGATWTADISARHFASEIVTSIPIVRQLSLLILVAWAIWRLINRIESRQLDQGADPTTVMMVGKVAKLAVAFLIVLPVFQMLGISISGILAFGGVGGLVVGMAAKDLLANFFGSLIIYMDRPFKVGDWVRSPDRSIEGTVEYIGFRVTRIRTFDKRPLYVPNSVFTSIVVENPSRMLNRRIYETVGVRYQDARKIQPIMDDVRAMLEQHPDIDQNCTIIVNFNSFAASSLDFFIYTFTKTTAWVEFHGIKQDVLLKVMDIIHSHGADCAFPTRTLHLDSMPEALQASQNSDLSMPAATAQNQ